MRHCHPDLLHALGGRCRAARAEGRRPPCFCFERDVGGGPAVLSKFCHGFSIQNHCSIFQMLAGQPQGMVKPQNQLCGGSPGLQ